MTEPTTSLIDLGAEAAIAPYEYLFVAAVALAAVAYLGRGVWRKRRRLASGEGCGTCGGCGASGACPTVPSFDVPVAADAAGPAAAPR